MAFDCRHVPDVVVEQAMLPPEWNNKTVSMACVMFDTPMLVIPQFEKDCLQSDGPMPTKRDSIMHKMQLLQEPYLSLGTYVRPDVLQALKSKGVLEKNAARANLGSLRGVRRALCVLNKDAHAVAAVMGMYDAMVERYNAAHGITTLQHEGLPGAPTRAAAPQPAAPQPEAPAAAAAAAAGTSRSAAMQAEQSAPLVAALAAGQPTPSSSAATPAVTSTPIPPPVTAAPAPHDGLPVDAAAATAPHAQPGMNATDGGTAALAGAILQAVDRLVDARAGAPGAAAVPAPGVVAAAKARGACMFPADWPTRLPDRIFSAAELQDNYGLQAILPSFKNNTAITLGEELKQYEDWCRSPVEASRGANYARKVAPISFANAEESILAFAGYTFKFEGITSGGLSLALVEQPKLIAGFIDYLCKRGVVDKTVRNHLDHLKKVQAYQQSQCRVSMYRACVQRVHCVQ